MATNQTERVLELLRRFNNGEKVCLEALANDTLWYGKSEKTIRRDLDVIKAYFPESFELIRGGKGEKGCYKAITQDTFNNFMDPQALSLMALTFSMASKSDLFENFTLSQDDKKILEKELKDVNKIYDFKNKPFETTKTDNKILKVLEHSIKFHKCVILEYQVGNKTTKTEVKPYKILFINENFYVACEVEHEEYIFSMFRISKIKTIEDTKKTYHVNYDLEEFIKDIQTPFPLYKPHYRQHLVEVKLEVDKSRAFYFKAKQHLKSQKILEEREDGNLILSFRVTQELEVESLIKSWLPHIKVISPLTLKEKIESELRNYLVQK